jgi:hypothetical protein
MKMNFNVTFQIVHEEEFDCSKWAMESMVQNAIQDYLKHLINKNTLANVYNINCIIAGCYTEMED